MIRFLTLLLLLPIALLSHTVHDGDYYVAGGTIKVPDVVQGDVYAFGSQVAIEGVVHGDVYAGGGSLTVNGLVHGDLRAFGGQVDLNGTIDGSVLLAAGNLQLGRQSVIQGSANLSGGVTNLSGTIGQDLKVRSSQLEFNAHVGKNVEASVATFHIGPNATIQGQLEYTSAEPALIDPGAQISGGVIYHASGVKDILLGQWKKKVIVASKFLSIAMNFVFSLVLGWIFIRFFPERMSRINQVLSRKLFRATLTGFLVILILPLIAILLLITIVGFPMGLALFAISILTFYSAKVLPIIWLSQKVAPRKKLLGYFLGLLIFFFIRQIPTLGSFTTAIFTLWGIGGAVLSKGRRK